jgi:hypothetical protein
MGNESNLKNGRNHGLRPLLYYRFHIEDKYSVDIVAQKMGIHMDTLYKWINGTNVFPADEIINLINATGDVKYLQFIADKCGYAIIPKIKNRKTAEDLILMANLFMSATGESQEKLATKNNEGQFLRKKK